MAALAGRAGRVLAKSSRTQCLNKDLVDTVAVDLTARPVVTAVNPPGVAAIRPAGAATHPAAEPRPAVMDLPGIHHRAELPPGTVNRRPATEAIQGLPPEAPRGLLPKRAKRCSGSD